MSEYFYCYVHNKYTAIVITTDCTAPTDITRINETIKNIIHKRE